MEAEPRRRTLLWLGVACGLLIAGCVAVYLRGWEMQGVYLYGFESSAFKPGFDCASADGTAWWLDTRDPTFYRRLEKLGSSTARVRFRGRASVLPGRYGHLGRYGREVEVFELLEMSKAEPCVPPAPLPAAPSAPSARGAPADAGAAVDASPAAHARLLGEQAEACYRDPMCSLQDAQALLLRADDADERPECLRFYYGIGTPKDWPRARKCLAHLDWPAGGSDCGQWIDVMTGTYLIMLADGQGGARDPGAVRRMIGGCKDSMNAGQILDLLDTAGARSAPSADGGLAERLDFCRSVGGPTELMNDCQSATELAEATFASQKVDKDVVARLEPAARPLYLAATRAWSAFAGEDAALIADPIDGTLMAQARSHTAANREAERRTRLRRLFAYRPQGGVDDAAAEKARADVAAAYAACVDALRAVGDAEEEESAYRIRERRDLKGAQDAWVAYRAAEVAFFAEAFGARDGVLTVTRDVGLKADRERVFMLRAELKGF